MGHNFQRHRDDLGTDEILFVDRLVESVQDAQDHAFLRIALIERYKTSGLSGNEWRFSCGLYIREEARKDWRLISTEGSLGAMVAALYPSIYGDFKTGKWTSGLVTRKVGNICFQWKGYPVWAASYGGEPIDFMSAAGHLPWAWIANGDQGSDPSPLKALCAQPGCADPHVTIYRLKERYRCSWGHKSKPLNHGESVEVRAFCRKHLRRGDSDLDDNDENYEVISGPGPDGNEPDPDITKEAMRLPPIEITGKDLNNG